MEPFIMLPELHLYLQLSIFKNIYSLKGKSPSSTAMSGFTLYFGLLKFIFTFDY